MADTFHTSRWAFQRRFPIMFSSDGEHLGHILCIYWFIYWLISSVSSIICAIHLQIISLQKVTGTLFWCIYAIWKAILRSQAGFHHSRPAALV